MKTNKAVKIISVFLCMVLIAVSAPLCARSFSVPDNMTIAYEKNVTLAPGITQSTSVVYGQAGNRMECYAVTADLNVDTVKIAANYKDNQCSTYGVQTLSNQVAAAERNHEEPYSVAASVNATYFNMDTGIPHGIFIMDGVKVNTIDTYAYYFFAIMKDGTPKIGWASEIRSNEENMFQAVSCCPMLIKDGKITERDDSANVTAAEGPRTCVGITPDNKVIFLVVDGRQSPRSCGISPYQAALMFQKWGCTSALMLDGGGSCTFGSKVPGEDFTVKNSPSDGGERSLGGTLLIISEAEPTGQLDHINLNCDFNHLTAGSSVTIDPVALDSTETPVSLPESGLSWSVSDPSKGSVTQDGVFTANRGASGDVSVYISYNGQVLGSIDFSIVVPDTIEFAKKKISAVYSGPVKLPLKAKYGDYPVAINADDIIAVHEYEFNGSVHDSLLDDYGYFDGLYFIAPDESMGVKTETLYMIPSFAEDESYISTMTIEFYKEGEEYFDFENATYQSEEVSYYRTVSNTSTNDDYNYFITDGDKPVYASYRFGLAMDEMEPPDELIPMWDAFSSMLGSNMWDAFLTLAGKISSDSSVTITITLDPKFQFYNIGGITISNNLFTMDSNEITVDESTNTATIVFRWNESFVREIMSSEEGVSSDSVSSTVMVKDFVIKLTDPSLAQNPAGVKLSNKFSISYDLIAWSSSAYNLANENEDLKAYAYKSNNKTGIRFTTDYAYAEENFIIFGDTDSLSGWSGSSYYVNGKALTGVRLLPDKDGTENEYYYKFNSFGTLQGKYTGVVKSDSSIRYSQNGTAVFAGLVTDENGDYYYIGESLEALRDTTVNITETNGLAESGEYEILPDGRVVISSSDGGLLSYGEYTGNESQPAVCPQGEITTGAVIKYYSRGSLLSYTLVKYGDIDKDGITDGCDSIYILCVLNGMLDQTDLSEAQSRAADCNSDSLINEDDYSALVCAGLFTHTIDQNNSI